MATLTLLGPGMPLPYRPFPLGEARRGAIVRDYPSVADFRAGHRGPGEISRWPQGVTSYGKGGYGVGPYGGQYRWVRPLRSILCTFDVDL